MEVYSMPSINQDDVLEILKIIEESSFDELHLEMGDLKLIVKKRGGHQGAMGELEPSHQEPTEATVPEEGPEITEPQEPETLQPPPPEAPAPREEPPASLDQEGLTPIKSPMLGTFYQAPKPGAPPFVKVGQVVSEDDTVCIIEVMKLFNTIKAGIRGRIVKICAENAQMVEFQQTLFLVEEVSGKRASKKGRAR
jgi:acetyl-CoA carboxylase biotin carboxyl carrier protein